MPCMGKTYLLFFLVVELFHPLSIPFPWHARVNLYVKHSARSHRDDLAVIWNEKDQVQQPRANKCRENYRNIKWGGFCVLFVVGFLKTLSKPGNSSRRQTFLLLGCIKGYDYGRRAADILVGCIFRPYYFFVCSNPTACSITKGNEMHIFQSTG